MCHHWIDQYHYKSREQEAFDDAFESYFWKHYKSVKGLTGWSYTHAIKAMKEDFAKQYKST